MPETLTVTISSRSADRTSSAEYTATADNKVSSSPAVPAAKVGTLSTRTDSDTGTLTMGAGHGFTTGVVIDIFWSGGSRYGVTVGTVAGDSVPIDGGTGDNLPTATTAITAMVPASEPLVVDGDNVTGIMADSPVFGYVHFTQSDDTPIATLTLISNSRSAYGVTWISALGTNPLASGSVAKIKFSHGAVTEQTMRSTVLRD